MIWSVYQMVKDSVTVRLQHQLQSSFLQLDSFRSIIKLLNGFNLSWPSDFTPSAPFLPTLMQDRSSVSLS